MDFRLSAEQVQLDDSVSRLLAEQYAFETRQRHAASERGCSADVWGLFAEMGWLAIATPSDHGGLDGGAAELLPVARAFGRALVVEPFVASAVLAATALRHAVPSEQKDRLLNEMAAGRHIAAFAHHAAGAHATHSAGSWTLNGRVPGVLSGDIADSVLVAARLQGEGSDCERIGLFWVDSTEAGLSRRGHRLIDQRGAADLRFDSARASALIEPSAEAAQAVRRTLDVGMAVLCADTAGAMRAAFDMTVAYLGTRRQFGRTLAENQVLRHRAADMQVAIETVEAMAFLAAVAVDQPATPDPARDVAQAKLLAGRHGRWLGEQAVQLHGGIGMTDEYAVGHCLQRLTVNDNLLGSEDDLLDRLTGALSDSSNQPGDRP